MKKILFLLIFGFISTVNAKTYKNMVVEGELLHVATYEHVVVAEEAEVAGSYIAFVLSPEIGNSLLRKKRCAYDKKCKFRADVEYLEGKVVGAYDQVYYVKKLRK